MPRRGGCRDGGAAENVEGACGSGGGRGGQSEVSTDLHGLHECGAMDMVGMFLDLRIAAKGAWLRSIVVDLDVVEFYLAGGTIDAWMD